MSNNRPLLKSKIKFLVLSVFIIGLIVIQPITIAPSLGQTSTAIVFGVTAGEVFFYKFNNNGTETGPSYLYGVENNSIIYDQDIVRINITYVNASDPFPVHLVFTVANLTPFSYGVYEPYVLPLSTLEEAVKNESLSPYGNVVTSDNGTVLFRDINPVLQNVHESSFNRSTGVLNYWLKYYIENGTAYVTSLVQTNETVNYILIRTFQTTSNDLINKTGTIITSIIGFEFSIVLTLFSIITLSKKIKLTKK